MKNQNMSSKFPWADIWWGQMLQYVIMHWSRAQFDALKPYIGQFSFFSVVGYLTIQ